VVRSQSSAQVDPLPRRIVAGELTGTLSKTCSCPIVEGVVAVLPHDVSHSE
jgi:hypothetical protein